MQFLTNYQFIHPNAIHCEQVNSLNQNKEGYINQLMVKMINEKLLGK